MVGADRFDESAGERGAPAPPDAQLRTLPPEPHGDDSYWSNIDYPEPRARPAGVHAPVRAPRGARSRAWLGAFVAAVLLVGGGAYAAGRANGHAPVPGLHRRVDAQGAALRSRAAKVTAQARALAADEAQLRSLRAQASQSAATQTACRDAIAAADRAFGTESEALHALAGSDLATAQSLADRFGTELDEYAGARAECVGAATSV